MLGAGTTAATKGNERHSSCVVTGIIFVGETGATGIPGIRPMISARLESTI